MEATLERSTRSPKEVAAMVEEVWPRIESRAQRKLLRKGMGRHADHVLSEIGLRLTQAAQRWDEARGVLWRSYAEAQADKATLDALRQTHPLGIGTRVFKALGVEPPTVDSLNRRIGPSDGGRRIKLSDMLPTQEDPVGSGLESLDIVDRLARLAGPYGWVIRALYTEAGLTMSQLGRRTSLSESRISQSHAMALQMIRKALDDCPRLLSEFPRVAQSAGGMR
jgi:hypothetical protein